MVRVSFEGCQGWLWVEAYFELGLGIGSINFEIYRWCLRNNRWGFTNTMIWSFKHVARPIFKVQCSLYYVEPPTRWQWYYLSREEVQDLEDKSFEWENECWSFAFVQRISTDFQTWNLYMEALTLEHVRIVVAVHYMEVHPNRVCAFGRFRDADGWA